ncbi:MAG: TIGR03985 family CRISPR-associated protein [Pseudanabaenaceae cyanobacterium]
MPAVTLPNKLELLRWLVRGSLNKAPHRTARLWYLLQRLYGGDRPWCEELPKLWTYPDLRDRLFAESHPKGDHLTVQEVRQGCWNESCICRVSTQQLLQLTPAETTDLFGSTDIAAVLAEPAFGTVHNSVRQDLKILVHRGWLHKTGSSFACVPETQWPLVAKTRLDDIDAPSLVQALTSISFVYPEVEPLLATLGDALEPRVFLQIDLPLVEEDQERVNDYHSTLAELWRAGGQPVTFRYGFREPDGLRKQVKVVVYPVCLHYMVRAKYLSAYGRDPHGQIGWHNYRLDRIASPNITVLDWCDRRVPKELQVLRETQRLPTIQQVQEALAEAWGFRFYAPKQWLLLRFPAEFAEYYVRRTQRHPTFREIAYREIETAAARYLKPSARLLLQELLQRRSPEDAYFEAWVRAGDVNIAQRMRMWRPQGEVLAPGALRAQMQQEAQQELNLYEVD